MATFLVSGGAGFIGSNIVDHLVKLGDQVVVVDNLITGSKDNLVESMSKIRFVEADLRRINVCRDVLKDVDYVIHQAALGSVPRSVEDPVTTLDNNIMSTANLLKASVEHRVKRFVFASSASVYGNSPEQPKHEGMKTAPANPYAVSKLACEELVRVFQEVYGLETVSLRYFNIFGPRQNPEGGYAAVVPKFISRMLRNKHPTIFGDGEQTRDFTYVANAVYANMRACQIKKEYCGKAYNVGAQGVTSINELFVMIAKEIGIADSPEYVAPRIGDIKHNRADISNSIRFLGYCPTISVEEGITRTVDWYRKRMFSENSKT